MRRRVAQPVESPHTMRRAATIALPLLLVLGLTLWRATGPGPRPVNAPPEEFSAPRAFSTLREVLRENVPHPVGSAANRRVRERIETKFRALGYDTTVQRRFACNAAAVCAQVENVIARAPGSRDGDIVLLVSHYDSVPASPGVADDGMGVATMLEVARAIRGETFRNRVVFLIDDGEEAGLLGAEAFVADETLLRDVAVVVNVEMRGTYGASNMFETSRGNRWLIRHLANALERPQASSLFYTIYDRLPNDTDVTVFKRAGKGAINFAAIRGVNRYHTPLDNFDYASPRTLQHHGDNVLQTLRVLANADLAATSSKDATYFDVLGFFLVWWPQEWTVWIAALSLIALMVAARRTPPRAMTFGVLAAFAALLLSALAGAAVAWIARIGSEAAFVPQPLPAVASMWLTGISAALLSAAAFNRSENPRAMLYGAAIVWHTIGIALAITLPGAAFLFVVPAVAVTLCALARAGELATSAVSATAAAIVFFPVATMLYYALGSGLLAVTAVLLGACATFIAPLFSSARVALVTLLLALVCAASAIALPSFNADHPRRIPLRYVDDVRARTPLWTADDVTAPMRRVASFARADASLTPWSRNRPWAASAPNQNVPRVELHGSRTGNRVTITVRTRRNADRLTLLFRGGSVVSINGVTPPPRPARFRSRVPDGWVSTVASGVSEMTVEIQATGPVETFASDATWSLPPAAAPLLQARAASVATTVHDGDATITRVVGRF